MPGYQGGVGSPTPPTSTRPPAVDVSAARAEVLALRRAREAVEEEVLYFAASTKRGGAFSPPKFFLGVLLSYLTIFLAGHFPADFWRWHALQFAIFFPLHFYRWARGGNLGLLLEFCWVANTSIVIYLALVEFVPGALDPFARQRLFGCLFAFATGPFVFIVLLDPCNAVVPHSIDHMMCLLIHVSPMFTAYAIKWLSFDERAAFDLDRELFPIDQSVGFWDYCAWPLTFIAGHAAVHAGATLSCGLDGHFGEYDNAWGRLFGPGRRSPYAALLGNIGDGGSEAARFLKYEAAMVCGLSALIMLTYPLYITSHPAPELVITIGTCLAALWHGARWYEYQFARITGAVDAIADDARRRAGWAGDEDEGSNVMSDCMAEEDFPGPPMHTTAVNYGTADGA